MVIGVWSGDATAATRVVTVHADGIEKTVKTEVNTVSEALERAGISVGEYDLVEPSADTEIIDAVFNINVYRARPVTVVDGQNTRHVMTAYTSERLIAADAGVVVYPEDRYEMEVINDIVETGMIGQRLKIIRANEVTIELYGNPLVHRTHAASVDEILLEREIELKDGDRVEPRMNAEIKANGVIKVIHTGTKTITKTESIPFETEFVYDSNRPAGTETVKTEGVNGERLVTYEVKVENDKVVKRTELQSVVKTKPQKAVVVVGSAPVTNLQYNESLESWLLALRMCESTGNYQINTGNGFYGAYQFMISTWDSIASRVKPQLVGVRPDLAAPADQDYMIVQNTILSTGGLASQNPGCYEKLGLSQFPPGY